MMVGRTIEDQFPYRDVKKGDLAFKIKLGSKLIIFFIWFSIHLTFFSKLSLLQAPYKLAP